MFENIELLQLFGYLGSVLIAVSLMMSAIVKLRIINLFGASVFATYGFLIGAMPVAILNSFIALVDIYYLIEIFSAKEYFKVLQVKPDSFYLKYFCDFHSKEIAKFQPSFKLVPEKNIFAFFVLRDAVPAGLVVASPRGEEELFIQLDYAAPGYRDFKMGKYVFKKIATWPGHDNEIKIKRFSSESGNPAHEKYLQRMGFIKIDQNGKDIYMLEM